MDCPACVMRVEAAIKRLGGARDIRADPMAQVLELTLSEVAVQTALEAHLRALGYSVQLIGSRANSAVALPEHLTQPWHQTIAGKHTLLVVTLVIIAFSGSFFNERAAWLYALATVIGVTPLARKAIAGIKTNPFGMNTLVTLAASGALMIGELAEGAVVVAFFLIGELLERTAAGRSRRGVAALAALIPKTAQLLEGDTLREIPAADLTIGQRVQVAPGARLPADGRVVAGQSHVDEGPITGESVPRFKHEGTAVFAGSINQDGVLIVEVTRSGMDNTLSRILHLVEQAEMNRSPTARFIDRFSRVYTPGVLLVAGLTMILPPLLTGAEWHNWLYRGLALLLIGCPCALVLSVPAAISSAISAGARCGLLIKGGVVLETLANVRTMAFDKTGTLTKGQPVVTDVVPHHVSEQHLLQLTGAVEARSTHPLARAITQYIAARGITLKPAHDARAIPGKAAQASIDGQQVVVASPQYAAALSPFSDDLERSIRTLERDGKTVVVTVVDGNAIGCMALRDEPRDDARQALAALRALGVSSMMLTGDNRLTGEAIGRQLGIAVQAELLPEDKHRLIVDLARHQPVAMVGDGINDAPALAQADVGIAMGGAADVALETAHAAILTPKVSAVVDLVRLARATLSNIRINIAIALGLKAVFLATTLLGVTGLWAAIVADTGATAMVTANALRLLRFKGR
jgi:Cd2+/Zn2+-exporting ATPase